MSNTIKVWVDGQVVEKPSSFIEISGNVVDNSWKTVTPVQARLALIQAGLLSQVDALIANSPPEIKTWYEYASSWERDHQYVKAFATQLKLSDIQVDDLFKVAKGM